MFKPITFEVVGDQLLHCESCELRIKRLLKGIPGVGQVRADARSQRINVLFDGKQLEPPAIAERLREAGYETRIVTAESDARAAESEERR